MNKPNKPVNAKNKNNKLVTCAQCKIIKPVFQTCHNASILYVSSNKTNILQVCLVKSE